MRTDRRLALALDALRAHRAWLAAEETRSTHRERHALCAYADHLTGCAMEERDDRFPGTPFGIDLLSRKIAMIDEAECVEAVRKYSPKVAQVRMEAGG